MKDGSENNTPAAESYPPEAGARAMKPLGKSGKKALLPMRQIEIVEGHDSGSCFWIRPVRLARQGESSLFGVHECEREEVSIEEDYVDNYLYFFLEKHYDEALSEPFRGEDCGPGFAWNLEHNVYSYKAVKKMLVEIRAAAALLSERPDAPKLLELKSCFGACNDLPVVIDFYERFCRRMETMLRAAPDYEMISFMGP